MKPEYSTIVINSPTKFEITGTNFITETVTVNVLGPESYEMFVQSENNALVMINPDGDFEVSKSSPTFILELTDSGQHGLQWDGNEMGNLIIKRSEDS